MTTIRQQLFALQDPVYQQFQSNLLPTLASETVIGVRIPVLRKFAHEVYQSGQGTAFLQELPHQYYDENNLHGFLIEQCRDFDEAIVLLDAFLPYVDNWATCDLMMPKILGKHRAELLPHIQRWMASDRPYTVRYGIGQLMRWYLDDATFEPYYLDWVAAVQSEEYYVNMMRAWYFATALAKQYEATLPILTRHQLDAWTHNKTIQKAVESYRITPEQKAFLRGCKR